MAEQIKQHEEPGLTPRDIAMIQAIVESMKKPYVDVEAVARQEKARERLRAARTEAEAAIAASQASCSHLRGDNTSKVAWHTQYWRTPRVYITDGYCQTCNKHFAPGVDGYEQMLRVPVGQLGIIA